MNSNSDVMFPFSAHMGCLQGSVVDDVEDICQQVGHGHAWFKGFRLTDLFASPTSYSINLGLGQVCLFRLI